MSGKPKSESGKYIFMLSFIGFPEPREQRVQCQNRFLNIAESHPRKTEGQREYLRRSEAKSKVVKKRLRKYAKPFFLNSGDYHDNLARIIDTLSTPPPSQAMR